MHTSVWSLVCRAIVSSSVLEQAVLLLLACFSIFSWALILMKYRALATAQRNQRVFEELFRSSAEIARVARHRDEIGASPAKEIFSAALAAWEQGRSGNPPVLSPASLNEKIQLCMQHTAKDVFAKLRWGLNYLASLSSASPFIGLFGTVWGIMATFQNLGDAKSASLAVVAPGISSALIATAAGLAVAIPAVMAYNWLLGRFEELYERTDDFSERLAFALRHDGYIGGQAHPAENAAPDAVISGAPEPVIVTSSAVSPAPTVGE